MLTAHAIHIAVSEVEEVRKQKVHPNLFGQVAQQATDCFRFIIYRRSECWRLHSISNTVPSSTKRIGMRPLRGTPLPILRNIFYGVFFPVFAMMPNAQYKDRLTILGNGVNDHMFLGGIHSHGRCDL